MYVCAKDIHIHTGVPLLPGYPCTEYPSGDDHPPIHPPRPPQDMHSHSHSHSSSLRRSRRSTSSNIIGSPNNSNKNTQPPHPGLKPPPPRPPTGTALTPTTQPKRLVAVLHCAQDKPCGYNPHPRGRLQQQERVPRQGRGGRDGRCSHGVFDCRWRGRARHQPGGVGGGEGIHWVYCMQYERDETRERRNSG